MRLRRHGHDRVERASDEVCELQLDDGPIAHPRGADRGADEALLRDRRVDHALLAELVQQSGGDAEGAAEDADVLAEEEDPVVLEESVAQGAPDRLQIGDLAGCSLRCGRCAAGCLRHRGRKVAGARHGREEPMRSLTDGRFRRLSLGGWV